MTSSQSTKQSVTWQDIAARKQAERASRIPREWMLSPTVSEKSQHNALSTSSPWRYAGILTDWELSLTDNHDASSLLGFLATGRIKSEDVVRAFCKRAAIAQQLTNCLTEILFKPALARARELDAHLERTGKVVGPLHGLPISLKDTFKIAGFDASIGIAALCFKPADKNSVLVDLLFDLGAVIHVKTNVPQTLMALDSHNNVFGRTLNPRNNLLTAGGSSGGEGALIAMRGSILGVGTDVGGSIRIPASCNGLFAIKPSIGFVPYAGQEEGSKPGAKRLGLDPVAGPIATKLRDCEMFLQIIADANPSQLDSDVVIDSWKQLGGSIPDQILRIGVVRSDGHVQPLPVITKLMNELTTTLSHSKGNIEVIEVDLTSILSKVLKTFNGIISIDGANTWFDHLEATGEPLSPWLQGRLTRRPIKSVEQIREAYAQKNELQAAFLHAWREDSGFWQTPDSQNKQGNRRLDALIMPVAPHPILPIDRWNTVNYTAALNLLDLPAGIIPVRSVTEADLLDDIPDGKPAHAWEQVNREHWTKVDRKIYIGSPLSVQVVTPRLQEHKLVGIMNVIDKNLDSLRTARLWSSRL